MLRESENAAPIARDQIVRLPGFSHRQKKIIGGVSGAIHIWQFAEYRRLGTYLIYESADIVALDERCQALTASDRLEFFELLLGAHEDESLLVPRINQSRRSALLRDQCTDEQIGIEYDAHLALCPSATRTETFRANFGQGFLDGFLDLLGRHMSITGAGFLYGLLKDAPASGLLDEFGEIALLHPLLGQKATHGYIGRLRDLDAPAHVILFHEYSPKRVCV